MNSVRVLFTAAACLGLIGSAQAHMPYLLPNTLDASTRDHVSVIASFTETPFVADVVMKSDHYSVITPNGTRLPITQVIYLKDLAAFEVATPENGVYRITSGQRLGRKSKMQQSAEGGWEFLDERSTIDAGAKVVDVQSITTADAYILRGPAKRSDVSLQPTGVGVEIKLLTLPDHIEARQPVQAELLFQGKPLANTDVIFYRGTLDGLEGVQTINFRSDAKGKLEFTVPAAGTYLALIRHRTESPADAETPWRSYSYTLTFIAQ